MFKSGRNKKVYWLGNWTIEKLSVEFVTTVSQPQYLRWCLCIFCDSLGIHVIFRHKKEGN
jgi:hypothetical protein